MPSSSSAATGSPLHPHLVATTSTSELANTLTLPAPVSNYGGYVQREEEQARFQQPVASSTREDRWTTLTPASDDIQSPDGVEYQRRRRGQGQEEEEEQQREQEQQEEEDPTVPTRRCSVKGCKKDLRNRETSKVESRARGV
ncbi:hypothetical protein K443DRAFT_5908 [Laccaria amethystina LaAM-08-1]|uniref:Unplaced genomic scaffold K443scaffold_53, whole genome shotgun sequence n=1 Tax=Laccaria amethystina LaAM-08-1 TaxID=1095629 RepID=A0A0C9XD00_9AGAR|nr:hypothetical protein K443DRAFT_5908 [Laccaria amethystina LaAM-08-1]